MQEPRPAHGEPEDEESELTPELPATELHPDEVIRDVVIGEYRIVMYRETIGARLYWVKSVGPRYGIPKYPKVGTLLDLEGARKVFRHEENRANRAYPRAAGYPQNTEIGEERGGDA